MVARIISLGATLVVAFLPFSSGAYNYLEVDSDGAPIGWAPGSTITYYLDPGAYGYLTNAQAYALLQEAMKRWEDVDSANAPHFEFGGYLPEDVKGDNYKTYVTANVCYTGNIDECATDYQKELKTVIIFDENDEIVGVEFCVTGSCSAYSGAGVYDGNADAKGTIRQGFIVLGQGVLGVDLPDVFGTFVHEVGHLLGLAHPSLNQQITYNELIRDITIYMPTMSTVSGSRGNLNPDDLAGIASLYPTDSFNTGTASIRGTVLKSDASPLTHANVIARNVEDPFCKAYSSITGRTCPYYTALCETSGNASGVFTIDGLPPGTYTLEVEGYSDAEIARTVAPGIYDPPVITGNAEFWNENDAVSDDPLASSTITLQGGDSIEGLVITLDGSASSESLALYISADFFNVVDGSECTKDDSDYYEIAGVERPASDDPTPAGGGCSLIVR